MTLTTRSFALSRRIATLTLLLATLLAAGSSTRALAGPEGCRIDQSQTLDTAPMAAFSVGDLAQSFAPSMPTMCGAEIWLWPGAGTGGDVTIELWDALPNAGGSLLASGTADNASPGEVVQVSWLPVSVAPGATYFLVLTSTDADLVVAGDVNDPYAGGQIYATPGFLPFPASDFTFQTYGLPCSIDVEQLTKNSNLGSVERMRQSFRPTRSRICGASVLLDEFGVPANVTLALWDRHPARGGHLLAEGTALGEPGEWLTVSWPTIAVDPTRQYFLVCGTDNTNNLIVDSDQNNPYPGGIAYSANTPFESFDLAFRTYADPCEVEADQPVVEFCGQQFGTNELVQSIVPQRGSLAGAAVQMWPVGGVADITIALWDDLPSNGGTLLASATDVGVDCGAGEEASVEWAPVPVDAGVTYYLVFTSTDPVACIAGTFGDPYPLGGVIVNGFPVPDGDWTFKTYSCGLDCHAGNVNQTAEVVLTVNGQASPAGEFIPVASGTPLVGTIVKPSSGGNGKFVLHAVFGAPTSETVVSLPANIGSSCFDLLLPAAGGNAMPGAIWNNIGKVDKVGASTYFDGTSIPDPARAPADFLSLPTGDDVNLKVGTLVTFHGVILDLASASPKRVSVTNSAVVRIE